MKYQTINKQSENKFRELTLGEEIFNSITHGIGALFGIAALSVLTTLAVMKGDAWHVGSVVVFGSSLIILYTSSTLYHSFTRPKVKNLFARFDHISIFLLIAGTYTPFLLITLRGLLGWILFGIIWSMAITGMIIRSIYLSRFRKLMVAVYLIMGWMFLFALGPLMKNLPAISTIFLFTGGACYSIGVIFYALRDIKFAHGIWHLFVLAGSVTHFFAILFILI